MIKFKCTYCGTYYEVPDEMANGKACCHACQNYFIVPPYSGDYVVQSQPLNQPQGGVPYNPAPQMQQNISFPPPQYGASKKVRRNRTTSNNYSQQRPPRPPYKKKSSNLTPVIIFLVMLLVGGSLAYNFVQTKRKKAQKQLAHVAVTFNNDDEKKEDVKKVKKVVVVDTDVNESVDDDTDVSDSVDDDDTDVSESVDDDDTEVCDSVDDDDTDVSESVDDDDTDVSESVDDEDDYESVDDDDEDIAYVEEDEEEEAEDDGLTPVERHGQLHIKGNKLLDSHGKQIALHGMSMFHCGDGFKFRNYELMKWLRDDWKCDVLRLAILPELYKGRRKEQDKYITEFIDNCVKLGVYVILDFHGGGPPKPHYRTAKAMFAKFSKKYAKIPNIIYEPYNEPCGLPGKPPLSWSKDLKPYHKAIIKTIRRYDKDNIVILGTPSYSLRVDKVIEDPIKFDRNVMYVAHFYAASHTHPNRKWVYDTLMAGLPVFISEFGTCEYTGNGKLDYEQVEQWMKLLDKYKVSWCNWSVHDKDETASIIKAGANPQGSWDESDLRDSGKLIRKYLRKEIDLDSIDMEDY